MGNLINIIYGMYPSIANTHGHESLKPMGLALMMGF